MMDKPLDMEYEMTAISEIADERARQINKEGWSSAHDDEHTEGQLAQAALCYVYASIFAPQTFLRRYWPWDDVWWKPSDERRNLVKAGALIAAEIDRIDRIDHAKNVEADAPVLVDNRSDAEIKAYNLHYALRALVIDYQELVKDTNSEPTFESDGDADKMAERALYDNMPLADWEPPTPAVASNEVTIRCNNT